MQPPPPNGLLPLHDPDNPILIIYALDEFSHTNHYPKGSRRALHRRQGTGNADNGGDGDRVEVADPGDVVAVRDSKDPGGPGLVFTRATWSAFVTRLKNDA